jgi:hypothetical protein
VWWPGRIAELLDEVLGNEFSEERLLDGVVSMVEICQEWSLDPGVGSAAARRCRCFLKTV